MNIIQPVVDRCAESTSTFPIVSTLNQQRAIRESYVRLSVDDLYFKVEKREDSDAFYDRGITSWPTYILV